ncbi:MAG TPA: glycosyltransferase family 4 protein [Candidatus Polarisedimenticolaceae bacterium]|nr:glycosyltransferase family 4 protein [Candidatus Polarisedimenticolaceae bacterium]
MRIVYLSHYYPPEMGAPAARVSAFARRWAAAGHDVTVLTTFPNHPTGVIPPAYRGHARMVEHDRGVRVVRTYLYAAANKGIVKRSLCYASFAVSSVVQGYGPLARPDVLIATSPQFLATLSGWALSRLKGVPLVTEIRDLWPDSIVAVGALSARSPVVRALGRCERFVYGQSALLVSVTQSFVPILHARGARAVVVVPNGADPSSFGAGEGREEARRRFGLDGKFVASFVGTLGMAHGLDSVLDAAERLRDRRDVVFWLVGDGARRAELEGSARRRGLANVRFEGQVPRERVPDVLAASDAAMVLLRADPLFETVLPSKMFEAMAARCPVVLGVAGESKRLLEESGGGIAIEPGSGEALAQAVVHLASDPDRRRRLGAAGRAFVTGRFSHDTLAERYLSALQDLVDSSSR